VLSATIIVLAATSTGAIAQKYDIGATDTAPNSAIQKYMNEKKVPQLFVQTGATKWNDPKQFPWTMGWPPSYQSEGRIYAKCLSENKLNPVNHL
jgi:hypothetical protein